MPYVQPEFDCPGCHRRLTHHELIRRDRKFGKGKENEVKPGAVSVCGFCTTTVVFDAQLRPRRTTMLDMYRFEEGDPEGMRLLRDIRTSIDRVMIRPRRSYGKPT